jgi:hypothetical protein
METRFRSPAQRQPAGKWTSSSRYKHQKRVRCIAAPQPTNSRSMETVKPPEAEQGQNFGPSSPADATEPVVNRCPFDLQLRSFSDCSIFRYTTFVSSFRRCRTAFSPRPYGRCAAKGHTWREFPISSHVSRSCSRACTEAAYRYS